MNKRDLIVQLADETGLDRKKTSEVIETLQQIVTAQVKKGEPVMLSGFCKFARVDRKARMGRNPQTGEAIKIKATRKVRITPLKAFKDAVVPTPRKRAV